VFVGGGLCVVVEGVVFFVVYWDVFFFSRLLVGL